ncbi:hypothetical protein Gogos_013177, partial [Gossypium gossypioides]|nr:hypothetical protein [Gossypium gossypioides]
MVMAWIRLPGLPGHMYKRKILWEIGGMIGRVAKLDFNTDNGVWGKFARMAIYFNLGKGLISQVLINGVLQRIGYEYLSTPLETLNNKIGPYESRPTKETNLTQKELGFVVE